ncbi:fumarylacetoacetate hydrolase family protein [Bacillus sp. Marseille-Q1617]|uniref:fumarylacetoacetate hydrolase family protein n=1 Tax=Bacillus sp. Marseille-Q1617 TaxID=2736887 RepID=UPI00158900E5|nr:fumarylacetoacetate hydrolase family protein [Bacillus sp. Marseille-Q1617]
MKLASFEVNAKETYGVVEGEHVIDLVSLSKVYGSEFPQDVQEAIKIGEEFLRKADGLLSLARRESTINDYTYSFDEIEWLPPIPAVKRNVMCVGKNYREHAIEMGSEKDIPEHIMIFTKATNTVIGHKRIIPVHDDVTDELDYEGELAVVIGKKGKGIALEDAMDHVFGYTIVNDLTARDLQKKHGQFFIGKSLDSTCPIGPYIVTKDNIEDPHQLTIRTRVNGEVRQSSSTDLMIFRIPDIISILSKGMTLEPGDIIATGTPAGVGKGFNPPRFLKAGDEVEIEVEGIGILTNQLQ